MAQEFQSKIRANVEHPVTKKRQICIIEKDEVKFSDGKKYKKKEVDSKGVYLFGFKLW